MVLTTPPPPPLLTETMDIEAFQDQTIAACNPAIATQSELIENLKRKTIATQSELIENLKRKIELLEQEADSIQEYKITLKLKTRPSCWDGMYSEKFDYDVIEDHFQGRIGEIRGALDLEDKEELSIVSVTKIVPTDNQPFNLPN